MKYCVKFIALHLFANIFSSSEVIDSLPLHVSGVDFGTLEIHDNAGALFSQVQEFCNSRGHPEVFCSAVWVNGNDLIHLKKISIDP